MTFRGLHEHSLDPKDRITVPAQYRAALAEGIVLMMGIEPCVWDLAGERRGADGGGDPLGAQPDEPRRPQDPAAASSRTRSPRKLDSAGRIRLSKQLIEHAGLDGRCVITGTGTRLEIWTPDEWFAEDEEIDEADAGADREPCAHASAGAHCSPGTLNDMVTLTYMPTEHDPVLAAELIRAARSPARGRPPSTAPSAAAATPA